MNRNVTIFSALVASLIYIGSVAGIIWIGVKYLGEGIAGLPSEWLALSSVVLFTMVFCSFLISHALKNNNEKRSQQVLQDRLGVYKRFLDAWLSEGLINSSDPSPFQLTYAMSLLASDGVLKQYRKLLKLQESNPLEIKAKQQVLQRIILEMRRDLGQPNFAILQGDLDFIFKHDNSKSKTYNHETQETYSPA